MSNMLHSVQALRAIAASMVVADHILLKYTNNDESNAITHIAWTLGSSGVFMFFVVSGFIMAYVSWNKFNQKNALSSFLFRRIIRIIPLYWIGTLAALAFHKILVLRGAEDGWREIAYSLAFIPYKTSDGLWNPILPQGWSLNYEMMFYVLFAIAMLFHRVTGLTALCVSLLVFVVLGPFLNFAAVAYLASPIVLWFVLGIAIAFFWKTYGLKEPLWLANSAKRLEPIGDASYSIYLVHGFVLTILFRVFGGMFHAPFLVIAIIGFLGAIISGWFIYILVEKPLLKFCNHLLNSRKASQRSSVAVSA